MRLTGRDSQVLSVPVSASLATDEAPPMAATMGSRNEASAISAESITSRPFWATCATKGGSPGSCGRGVCSAPAATTISGTSTRPAQPR